MGDLKDFKRKLDLALKRAGSPENMRKYGEQAAEAIRVRTRLGYGVPKNDAPRKRLKPIAQRTREKRARNPDLSEFTSPNRSNLTETGQLTESIKVKSVSQGKAAVGPTGQRRGEDLSNEDLAEYVSDAGRPFNNLSDNENKRIAQSIDRDLQKELKRI